MRGRCKFGGLMGFGGLVVFLSFVGMIAVLAREILAMRG